MNENKTRAPSGITRNHCRKDTATLRLGKWQRFKLARRNVIDITKSKIASKSRKHLGKNVHAAHL